MTLPAQIRVNAQAQFPSLVYGTGPITLDKKNGTWAIGFTIAAFPSQAPPPTAFATDYLLAWDDVQKVFFKVSIATIISSITASGATRTQRRVTAAITVQPTDQILNCAIPTPTTCVLPAAAGRLGSALTFKDLGQATANPITFTTTGSDAIDGAPNFVLRNNFAWVTFVPFNDGTGTGWMIQ